MPRDHARIQTKIWQDKDFRALPADAQHVYMTVLSQSALSYVGVIDYFPGRVAALSKANTARKVEAAIKGLEDSRFVVVDRDTHELLIRTFVRHDGVLARANMGKAMGRALEKVVSLDVRQAILDELARCFRDDMKAAGWIGFRDLYPDDFETVSAMASAMPLRMASGM